MKATTATKKGARASYIKSKPLLLCGPGYTISFLGEWRSPAARYVRDVEVPGSNPGSPTRNRLPW